MLRRCFSRLSGAAAAGGKSAAGSSLASLSDPEIVQAVRDKKVPFYGLEKVLEPDYQRAIKIRRDCVKDYIAPLPESSQKIHAIDHVPFTGYDWSKVVGSNCENIVGYVPVPVGLAGPILMDGNEYPIPMATTEGALIASTHRGARAITQCGGASTAVLAEGMTRAPVIELPSLKAAAEVKEFIKNDFAILKAAFESTTRFGKLLDCKVTIAGRKVYIRFRAFTGDAMGMNMITKGVDKALDALKLRFPEAKLIAISGNYCTDKKPSAINWIEGRGKSVVAEAVVSKAVVEKVLKTTVDSLIAVNHDKNFVGSALAGSIGGFNAHAANAVAAIFLATGQDPAQVVESSMCLTTMTKTGEEGDLLLSVTMPSIEVGTIGGGTNLPAQRGMLELIGCAGSNQGHPGANASLLARVIACGVLSAELSLMAGLAANHLTRAHMELGRK